MMILRFQLCEMWVRDLLVYGDDQSRLLNFYIGTHAAHELVA